MYTMTIYGMLRTSNGKIWFWISCWTDEPIELPAAA